MISFYKPNSTQKGHALGLSFNSKEGKLFLQFIKQTSWDATKKRGGFKDGAKFNITLNATEIGALLNCAERSIPGKLFHASEKGNTSIDYGPYAKKVAEGEKAARDGMTISVNPRANAGEEKPQQFGFWWNEAETRLFKEYLTFVLDHFFSADYSAEKKKKDEYFKNKENQAQASPESQDPAQATEEVDPFA